MLESFATRIVEKYVAPYADVDPEQLRVAVLLGQVTLTDVKLKTSAFDALGFPLTVCSGRVGEVVIDVTWSALTAKPAKVHLRDVTIVIGPSGTDASADVRSSRLAVLQKEELQRDEEARMLRLVCVCSCVHVCMCNLFFISALDVCVSVPFALPFHASSLPTTGVKQNSALMFVSSDSAEPWQRQQRNSPLACAQWRQPLARSKLS